MKLLVRNMILPVVFLVISVSPVEGAELNKDGMDVVRLGAGEYTRISEQNRVVTDRAVTAYITQVARSLIPKGVAVPKGMSLSVTVLDKKMPEVYSLSNGVIVITTGALLSLDNEAQLAAVLSHEMSHILDAHYPGIYQAFKEKERKQRRSAFATGLAGVVVGTAVDYTVQTKTHDIYADADAGDISYREAFKKAAAIQAGAGVLEGFSDVYQSLPPETKAGSGDPRIPLEMVADAEGLKLMTAAGYDPRQAGEAWRALRKASDRAREGSTESLAMAFLPPEMRTLISGVSGPAGGIRAERLTRTVSQNPPDRPGFLDTLAGSKEISALKKGGGKIGREQFAKVIGNYVMGDAKAAFDSGDYATAKNLFQTAWDSGKQTAPIAYYLGRSQVGEFAFAASEREKEAAEEYLLKATKLDPKMPEPYKALGDLYGEWEMYREAAAMYRQYLKAAPKASDRSRIERQIQKMERKAK